MSARLSVGRGGSSYNTPTWRVSPVSQAQQQTYQKLPQTPTQSFSSTAQVDVVYCRNVWTRYDINSGFLQALGFATILAFLIIFFAEVALGLDLPNAPMFVQLGTCDFTFFGMFYSGKCQAKNMGDAFYFFLGAEWAMIDGTSGAHRTMMRARSDADWRGQSRLRFFLNDSVYELWLITYWFMLVAAIQSMNLAFILCIAGGWMFGRMVCTAGQLWAPRYFKPVEVSEMEAAISDRSTSVVHV